MSDKLEQLREEKRQLDAALRDAGRDLKRAKDKAREARRKEQRAGVLSAVERNTVLIVYTLTDYTGTPAARYLWTCGRKHRWPEKTWQELEVLAEDTFLEVDPDELAALGDMEEPSDVEAMKAALVFVEDWKLAKWTADMNRNHGVAPSTESVLQKFEEQRVALPEAVRPPSRGSAANSRDRVWVAGWRIRWGGQHARIRVREDIPTEELRSKVAQMAKTWSSKI